VTFRQDLTCVPSIDKTIDVIPVESDAVAVNLTLPDFGRVEEDGLVIVTVGILEVKFETVTETGKDVVEFPAWSYALAVREYDPFAILLVVVSHVML